MDGSNSVVAGEKNVCGLFTYKYLLLSVEVHMISSVRYIHVHIYIIYIYIKYYHV